MDRVFTRLGAHDRILSGSQVLSSLQIQEAIGCTGKRFCFLEGGGGRGTATYDGTAIACAVVADISQRIKCRTLFSTHYHSLVEEFASDQNVRLGHMVSMSFPAFMFLTIFLNDI